MGLIRLRNPLAYPGGRPGYDPNHFAGGAGIRFSGVATPLGFQNILASSATLSNYVGNIINAMGPGTLSGYKFPGVIETTPKIITIAAIFTFNSMGASQGHNILFANSYSGPGHNCLLDLGWGWEYFIFGPSLVLNISHFNWVPGVSYFVVLSISNTYMNILSRNMNTGQLAYKYTIINITMSGPDENHFWINSYQPGGLTTHAVMYSVNNFLSSNQLKAWANDPWSFWYPENSAVSYLKSTRMYTSLVNLSGTNAANYASIFNQELDTRLLSNQRIGHVISPNKEIDGIIKSASRTGSVSSLQALLANAIASLQRQAHISVPTSYEYLTINSNSTLTSVNPLGKHITNTLNSALATVNISQLSKSLSMGLNSAKATSALNDFYLSLNQTLNGQFSQGNVTDLAKLLDTSLNGQFNQGSTTDFLKSLNNLLNGQFSQTHVTDLGHGQDQLFLVGVSARALVSDFDVGISATLLSLLLSYNVGELLHSIGYFHLVVSDSTIYAVNISDAANNQVSISDSTNYSVILNDYSILTISNFVP